MSNADTVASPSDRLAAAEAAVFKVRQWLSLMADRGPREVLAARELCLLLDWDPPQPGQPMCARCGAVGPIHGIHY